MSENGTQCSCSCSMGTVCSCTGCDCRHHNAARDYPTNRPDGLSFINNRWVYTGAEGYRVKPDPDDEGLFMIVRYDATGETPFYGGRGLPEAEAHARARRLAGN